MRIKKWEKIYWGIVLVIIVSLSVWILTWDKGFEGTKNGEPHTFSKTSSALAVLVPAFFMPLWIWFVLRFWFLKSNDFVCKRCGKEFSGRMETEKNVCQTCYNKKRR